MVILSCKTDVNILPKVEMLNFSLSTSDVCYFLHDFIEGDLL
jgi:hypothetical protein